MIDVLKDTLSKVNEWIKFAEAKNGANVAFCSASIFGLSKFMLSGDVTNIYACYYLVFVLIFLGLSMTLSLFSFVPKLKAPWIQTGKRDKDDNLLYFGHACKYSASAYLDKIYNNESQKSDDYDLEYLYASQIVINSNVAFIKFKQFDIAMWFTLTAILSPIGILVIFFVR